jgi:hypothetical protein
MGLTPPAYLLATTTTTTPGYPSHKSTLLSQLHSNRCHPLTLIPHPHSNLRHKVTFHTNLHHPLDCTQICTSASPPTRLLTCPLTPIQTWATFHPHIVILVPGSSKSWTASRAVTCRAQPRGRTSPSQDFFFSWTIWANISRTQQKMKVCATWCDMT